VVTADGCAAGGSLSVGFRPGVTPNTNWTGSWGEWRFDAPPDTRISAFSIYRFVHVHSKTGPPPEASSYRLYENAIQPLGLDECNPSVCHQLGFNPGVPRDPANARHAHGVDFGRIVFHFECWRSDGAPGCPTWTEPTFQLYAADVTLWDPLPPALVGVAGNLSGAIGGRRRLAVRGLDRGGGLHRIRLAIDGVTVADQPFAPTSKSCAKPFSNPVPCPLSGEGRIALETSGLTDGPHTLQVTLVDAAENAVTSDPYLISVNNAGATCPSGMSARLAARFRRSGRSTLQARAGRTVVITGRLRNADGDVISNADLRIFVRDRNSATFRQTRVINTKASGRFFLRVRAAPSRRIRIAYCAAGGGGVEHLRLKAAASSRIGARPRALTNGQSMLLRGRLQGGHVPSAGKLVEIQAFFRNRWRTISSVRSNARGEWRFRYRFDGTVGRVTYRFRVFLPEEAGYPYEAGASPPVRVVVTGA
jgi:hypothetical protein